MDSKNRRGGFSGAKTCMVYIYILKKRYNNAGRTFCDAIKVFSDLLSYRLNHAML